MANPKILEKKQAVIDEITENVLRILHLSFYLKIMV